jgi:O-antigen/teichoic acid export membrane protein
MAEKLSRGLILKQILQYTPGSVIPALVGLASTVIFTRMFDSQQYGEYAVATSTVAMGAAVASQWLRQGINRYLPGAGVWGSTSIKAAIAICLCFVVAGIMIPAIIAWLFSSASGVAVWRVYYWPVALLVCVTTVFGSLTVVLQAQMRALRFTIYQISEVSIRFLLGLTLICFVCHHPVSIIGGAVLGVSLLIPTVWHEIRMPPVGWIFQTCKQHKKSIFQMLSYGLPMTGWFISSTLLSVGDRYIIGLFRGPSEVGIYSANYGLVAGAVGLIASPVLFAAHPFLMRSWSEGNAEATAEWLSKISEWFAVAGIISVGILTVFSHDLALLFLGSDFQGGNAVMAPALGGVIAWQLGHYTHKPLEFKQRTGLLFTIGGTFAALAIALNLLLIPAFGYAVAAYVALFCYLAYALTTMLVGQSILPWTFKWKRIASTVVLMGSGVILSRAFRARIEHDFGYWCGLALAAVLILTPATYIAAERLRPLIKRRRQRSGKTQD